MVEVTTNLIVYPGLGSLKKLKLTTKLNVEATVFSDLFKNYIIKMHMIFTNGLKTLRL
jgi:hypothetical protein